jgi:hypothetical protein
MKELIKSLWAGHVPLPVAVWQYAVVYGLLLNVTTSILYWGLSVGGAAAFVLVTAYFLPLPFNFLVVVAVWRSAGRYIGPRNHADMARFGTTLWMLVLTAT